MTSYVHAISTSEDEILCENDYLGHKSWSSCFCLTFLHINCKRCDIRILNQIWNQGHGFVLQQELISFVVIDMYVLIIKQSWESII